MCEEKNIAESWIARYEIIQKQGDNSPEANELFWSFEALDRFCRKDPDKAWSIILLIFHATNSDFVLDNLAAGPLESLLAWNGPKVIRWVETEAASDERFKTLLGGVWQNLMTSEIWQRVRDASL
ncbi:MAG: DUF6869 domain-containing protein [Pseudomonadota bacterium]